MFDLEMLRVIWWLLLGILFIGFAVTDGFDFGAAILMPWITRNDLEKRIVLNVLGPHWEGNQVWIILAAGATFAAWPLVYSVVFSGAYFGILLLLLFMGIARPVSFKYRSKLTNATWRTCWDSVIFLGGVMPALLFGILVGNILLGLPFYFDQDLRIFYSGGFLSLFNPFALWCGLTSVAMLMMHGGLYLAIRTEAPIRPRAINSSRWAALAVMLLFAGGGIWTAFFLTGYQVVAGVTHDGYSNPLHKEVIASVGGWMANYSLYPFFLLAPLLGFLGAILAWLMARVGKGYVAFIASGFSIAGIIATVGVSMFPFILPSSINLPSGLLVWDASSSRLTLLIMLIVTLIFLPIILIYTTWVYRMLRGKITSLVIEQNRQSY